MSRTKYRQTFGFLGLAGAVLLVAIASLAQAQTALYWTPTGSAAWSGTDNWTSTTYTGSITNGGSIINNGGTATIAPGDNVTDNSNSYGFGNATVLIGGSSASLGGSGLSGYVNMTGGSLDSTAPLQEILGVAAGSGVFTQSGGVNVSYVPKVPAASNAASFSSLQIGFSNGGYGEYDLSGGSVGANAIYVGANAYSTYMGGFQNAGTGVFNQTGGSVGSLGTSGLNSTTNNAVGLAVGGGWLGGNYVGNGVHTSSVGTYTLGAAGSDPNNPNGPLFVGGCELVGGSGTGTFTQNSGTNAIIGGGVAYELPGDAGMPYNTAMGALFLGWYNGKSTTVSSVKGYLGYGVGTYNLNGGLLTGGAGGGTYPSGLECVGVGGTGYFNQSGGTNYCTSFLNVGGPGVAAQYIAGPFPGTPGSGSYTLSGGLVTCPTVWSISGGEADEYVGYGARGSSHRRAAAISLRQFPLEVGLRPLAAGMSRHKGPTTSTAGCSRRV